MMAEIYGIAGSGKTTYIKNQNSYQAIKPGFSIKIWTFFLFLILDSPLFIKHVFLFDGYNKKKILFAIIYKLRMVEVMRKSSPKINHIYDQGPIYSLCRLLNKSGAMELRKTGKLVDVLISRIKSVFEETIYLRCDDHVALERVLKRNTSHTYKKRDQESVMQDIAVWKKNYDYIHSRINSQIILNNS